MSRSEAALGPAPGPEAIRRLPCTSARGTFFREHQKRAGADRGCWWFSGTAAGEPPEGRFDLPAPRGTLYLAETDRVTARERCGRFLAHHSPIPVTFVEGRVVSTLVGAMDDLADLTHEQAAEAGVTREINTIDDYTLTATWAVGTEQEGFTGLQYFPRFSTGRDMAFAIFGDAGAHAPPGFSISAVTPLAGVLSREGIGIHLLPSAHDAVDDESENIDAR